MPYECRMNVMLNLFQHLTASFSCPSPRAFLILLRGQILKQVQDDVVCVRSVMLILLNAM